MHPAVILLTLPVIALGELPDKTMFASLLMATRARPGHVWAGAAAAFVVHVALAVTVGGVLLALLPRRAVDAVVAGLFLAGAVQAALAARRDGDDGDVRALPSGRRVVLSAFVVIFLAEWGDLTQLLIADLAARYGSPLSVGVGALAALWGVAALAVSGGRGLLRVISVRRVRQATTVVLAALGAAAAVAAAS